MSAKKPIVISSTGDLQQIQTGDFLDIPQGGTGSTTAAGALIALGAYPATNPSNFITAAGAPVQSVAGQAGIITAAQLATALSGQTMNIVGTATNVTGTVAVANGGTGANTLTAGSILVGNGTAAISAATGAQIVAAIGSAVVANATASVTATTANNLAGGVAGALAYQSAIGTTAFSAAGIAGQIVLSGGTGAPTFINQNAITLQSSQVTNALGFTPVNNAIVGTNNGLATLNASGQLLASQIPVSLLGAVVYQTTWNAATNTPALADGTGTKGYLYVVGTAGTTSLTGSDGIAVSQWAVGDWVLYDGVNYDKVSGISAEVLSVVGLTGSITAAQIATALSGQTMNIVGTSTNVTGTVAVANGGTGATNLTFGGILVGNGTGAVGVATAAQIVAAISTTAVANATSAVNVTGTVAVANGGTGATAFTAGGLLIGNGTAAVSVATGAQIVTAIGANAVTNATNATNATNVTGNVAIANGGTGATTAAAAATALGVGTGNTPVFAGVNAPLALTLVNDQGAIINPGSVVYTDSSGTFMLANAGATATSNAIGISTGTIASGGSGNIALDGQVTLTVAQWNAITSGSGGLTPGATYFLSPTTNGGLTTTPPTTAGQYLLKIGQALSTTIMNVNLGLRIQL